jgi:hypothetical protein
MKEKQIINPGTEYYVVSLKHTGKKDKFITLWRPDNKGYCWPISLAGTYNGFEFGYHLSDGNKPVAVKDIPPLFFVVDSEGRECIKNSRAVVSFIKEYQP